LSGFPKNRTIQQILDSLVDSSKVANASDTESSRRLCRPKSLIRLQTPDRLEYKWLPAGQNRFVFKILAAHDAHLAFASHNYESDPMLEVFIGGWANTKSVIRKNRTKPDVVEKSTEGILSSYEYRGFWVQWSDGFISAGREGEGRSFMSCNIDEHFPINFVGVCTAW
jgi:hypothetical protein